MPMLFSVGLEAEMKGERLVVGSLYTIAVCVVIGLILLWLKVDFGALFLGLALFIFEALIVGWLHSNKHMSGVAAVGVLFLLDATLVLYWLNFQVELYHPIYPALPPDQCDVFIEYEGGPEGWKSPEGFCTEQFIMGIISAQHPKFGNGKDWEETLMTAIEDDFREGDIQLPRYQRAVARYAGEREQWEYKRLSGSLDPDFSNWIIILSMVVSAVVIVGGVKSWRGKAVGVLIFWGAFQTIVGILGEFPEGVRSVTDQFYEVGINLGFILVAAPMALKVVGDLIDLATGHTGVGPWAKVTTLLVSVIAIVYGALNILINPWVVSMNFVVPDMIRSVLETEGMSIALAIKALTLGYLVGSGVALTAVGIIGGFLPKKGNGIPAPH